jgi:hypothetical protein
MTSTIDEPGAFDALEKALPGEPMFPLLGRDECAPAAITEWCRLRRNRAMKLYGDSLNATDKELLVAELVQCKNAEEVALEMGEWRKAESTPVADRPTYNEVIKSAEEIASADKRTRREQAVRHFREAAYHISEAHEILGALEILPHETGETLTGALGYINALADEYQIKRDQYAVEPTLPLGGQ